MPLSSGKRAGPPKKARTKAWERPRRRSAPILARAHRRCQCGAATGRLPRVRRSQVLRTDHRTAVSDRDSTPADRPAVRNRDCLLPGLRRLGTGSASAPDVRCPRGGAHPIVEIEAEITTHRKVVVPVSPVKTAMAYAGLHCSAKNAKLAADPGNTGIFELFGGRSKYHFGTVGCRFEPYRVYLT